MRDVLIKMTRKCICTGHLKFRSDDDTNWTVNISEWNSTTIVPIIKSHLVGETTSKQNLLSMSSHGFTEHSRRSSTTTVSESCKHTGSFSFPRWPTATQTSNSCQLETSWPLDIHSRELKKGTGSNAVGCRWSRSDLDSQTRGGRAMMDFREDHSNVKKHKCT